MELVKNIMELTRAYSLNMILASCFIIFSYAYYSEKFTILNFILLTLALCFVQLGANLFDCYIDVKTQLKKGINFENMRFSTDRKARLIRNKTFSLRQVEIILIILFLLATIIGIYFAITSTWKILLFAVLGGILTLLYPISSKFYMAEIIVGLIFGPLTVTGGYFALCNDFNINLFMLSWALFFTTIILLHTHNIMDWEFDIKEGKNTLAILTKNKKNAIEALRLMIIISYAIIFIGVIRLEFNPKMLYVFLTLPIATKLLESINDYINIKDIKFEPRWYWGFFENWEEIKERKLDYFMFRFYLARNFSFFFALFASIGAMI
ncbi:prenyltransferase [bacterium]|nr:prenyltransferase [bacterium]MBQ9149592.1 prenyltransferase [bacterium]